VLLTGPDQCCSFQRSMSDQAEKLLQVQAITGLDEKASRKLLEKNRWNLEVRAVLPTVTNCFRLHFLSRISLDIFHLP
jgi:hypothetical protein